MPDHKFKFLIGADPEFSILSNGQKLHASQIMKKLFPNTEESNMGYNLKDAGNIGWDGHDATAELRPIPESTPAAVVQNIGKLFAWFADKTKLFDLDTTSMHGPIGGHIHLQITNEFTNMDRSGQDKFSLLMASMYLPVLLGEDRINLATRLKNSYGKLHDIRFEQHRNQATGDQSYTAELRMLSAEWLTTPRIAEAVLSYFAVIYHEFLTHRNSFTKLARDKVLFESRSVADSFQNLALSNNQQLILYAFDKIKKHVKKFELYPEYKKQIDFVFRPDLVHKEKLKAEFNIMKGWGLENKRLPNRRTFLMDKTVMEAVHKKPNLDVLSRMVPIDFNSDAYVESFANELSMRVVATDLKLKNRYYLFGMKTGIDDIIISDARDQIIIGKEQIKSTEEIGACCDMISHMTRRAREKFQISAEHKAELIKELEKTFIIGLPYALRQKREYKKILNLVLDLETKPIPERIKADQLRATNSSKEISDQAIALRDSREDIETTIEHIQNGRDEEFNRLEAFEIAALSPETVDARTS